MRKRISTPMMSAIASRTNMAGRLIVLLLAWLAVPFSAHAQTYTLAPPPFLLIQNNSGLPLGRALISGLDGPCRPSAVVRRVGAIVVDTVQCQAIGSRPHIGNEIREVAPTIAHAYAAPAVVVEVPIVRILAAVLCGSPNHVFVSATPAAGCPVRKSEFAGVFSADTAAAFGQPVYQARRYHFAHGAAVTLAPPARMLIGVPPCGLASHDQSSKASA